jgi:predicted DNA-binding protein (UPF0251 family)
MARPVKPRWIGFQPPGVCFLPQVVPVLPLGLSILTIDELEALRLADLQGLAQEEAAERMSISRPTFGRIVEQARRKVAEALVHGRGIGFAGGVVRFHPPYGPFGGPAGRGRGPHGHGKGPWRQIVE